MKFNSLSHFRNSFPSFPEENIIGLSSLLSDPDLTITTEPIGSEFYKTLSDNEFRKVTRCPLMRIVKSVDGKIPFLPNYYSFNIEIGKQDVSSPGRMIYTGIIPVVEFNKYVAMELITHPSPSGSKQSTPAGSPNVSPQSSPRLRAMNSRSLIFTPTISSYKITNLDPAEVLLVFYNNANCGGEKFSAQPDFAAMFAASTQYGHIDQARSALRAGFRTFQTVNLGAGPRYLGIKFNDDDDFIEVKDYDFYHGAGKATNLINQLRLDQQPKEVPRPMRCVIS